MSVNENPQAKFPATTRGYSIVKIGHLDDAFSEPLELEASLVEGHRSKKIRKEKKERRKKN